MLSFLKKKPKPSTAFSIDERNLRYVTVVRQENGIQVNQYGSELLPDTIIDEYDMIINDAGFVARLRSVAQSISCTEANVIIPDAVAHCFHTHVAKIPGNSQEQVILDHLKTYCESHDMLDYQEYISEYEIILETDFGYDLHATLVPKKYVDHLQRLFRQAGISVTHIETAHHAVAKSCVPIPVGHGFVAISFGRKTTSISLFNGTTIVSHDVVSVGVEDLYQAIQDKLQVTREYAEKIITRHGVLRTHPDMDMLGELYLSLSPVVESIDRMLVAIGTEPYKIFGHRFETGDVVVFGHGALVKGLVGYLGERTNLRPHELDVWVGRKNDRAPIMNLPAVETFIYAEPLSLALLYLENK